MHVLMFSTDDRVFEAGSEVRGRMERLAEELGSLRIIVFTRAERREETAGKKLFLYPTLAAFSISAYRAVVALSERLAGAMGRPALITVQDPLASPIAFRLRRRFSVPVEIQVHTDFLNTAFRFETLKNRLRYHFYRWALRRADSIRVVSGRIRRGMVDYLGIPPERIVVLPVFADVAAIRAAIPASELRRLYQHFHPIVLTVGRLTREKNFRLALEIFAGFRRQSPNSLLLIIGDGPERGVLESHARSLGIAESVRFLGWQKDLVPYYKGADALLVTSRYEGYGRMFVEAAASGLPIISTDVGIVGELLKPDESALVFRTAEEGSAALERLFRDPSLREKLRGNATATVATFPDREAYAALLRASLGRLARGVAP